MFTAGADSQPLGHPRSHYSLPSSPARLPLDIFYLVRDHLKEKRLMGTAANFLPVSKMFYRLYHPVIDYSHIELREDNIDRVLAGVATPIPSSELDDESSTWAPRSKLSDLKTCTHLAIQDVSALRTLLKHQRALRIKALFTSVIHLSLGPDLVRHLGLSNDRHLHPLIRLMERTFLPIHLCVTYPSYDRSIEFLNRHYESDPEADDMGTVMEWEHFGEGLWDYYFHHGISHLVSELGYVWPLKSLVLHNIGGQKLPETSGGEMRVFFAPGAQTRVAKGVPRGLGDFQKLEEDRVRDMADIVPLWKGSDDFTFEFIGAGLISRSSARGALGEQEEMSLKEESRGAGGKMVDDTEKEVEALFWEQFPQKEVRDVVEPQIRFVSRSAAECCVCCGGN